MPANKPYMDCERLEPEVPASFEQELVAAMSSIMKSYGYERSNSKAANKFFESMSDTLETFARSHYLSIWKYPYRQPMWMLHFIHPKGGFGWIQISYIPNRRPCASAHASISGNWYIDDHELKVRMQYRHTHTTETDLNAESALAALGQHLKVVVSASTNDLVKTNDPYVSVIDRSDTLVSDFEKSLRVPV